MEQMTITRALAELKNLDKRIGKKIEDIHFVTVESKSKPISGFRDREQFEEFVKQAYQSLNDLIARRRNIKNAIIVSNATTVVKIGEKEMTVAEIIDEKKFIDYRQQLLAKMKEQLVKATVAMDKQNVAVQQELNDQLKTFMGKDGKLNMEIAEKFKETYLGEREARLIDPLNIRKEIAELEEDIQKFLTEVDFVLSESNAMTKISI